MRDRISATGLPHLPSGGTALDTAREVAEVLDELAGILVGARAIVEVAALPPVVAEPTAFRAAIAALVSDAVTHRGGMRPRIRVTADRCDAAWRITVGDNGLPVEARACGAGPASGAGAAVRGLGGALTTLPGLDGGVLSSFTVPAPA